MRALYSSVIGKALLVSGMLALGLSTSGCKRPGGETKKDAVAEKREGAAPIQAKFAKVTSQKTQPRLEVTGTLDPDERSEVAAQTSGMATEVTFDIGKRVKKGDVLVVLDAREAAMRLDAANATAASQRARLGLKTPGKFDPDTVADVKQAREAADLAKTDFERTKLLFEQGAVSKSQYDQAKSNKERAEAAYDMARNGADQAWAAMLASQSQAGLSSKSLDDTKIRAPFDGTIDMKRIAPGEYATPGRIVAVLVRDSPLRFKFEVPESQAALVSIGSKIDVRVAAYPTRIFQGEVKRIAASVKSQTRTLPVEAELPNDDHALLAGFFARGQVQLAGDPQTVLVVPGSAVLPVSGGSRLFVKKGDHVEERLVVMGAPQPDGSVEVSGQLAIGDEVAIENVSALSDGAPITE